MSLPDFLRLAGATARALRAEGLSARDTSVVRVRVVPEDLDVFGHVTNARYLSVLNLGRGDWVLRTGLMKVALQRRAPLLAGRIDVTYLAPLRLWQRIEISTRAIHWDAKWFTFEHRITSEGKPAATALVRALFRGPRGNVSPSDMLAEAGRETESPPMSDALRIWTSHGSER